MPAVAFPGPALSKFSPGCYKNAIIYSLIL
jgi:hypothetical protein